MHFGQHRSQASDPPPIDDSLPRRDWLKWLGLAMGAAAAGVEAAEADRVAALRRQYAGFGLQIFYDACTKAKRMMDASA